MLGSSNISIMPVPRMNDGSNFVIPMNIIIVNSIKVENRDEVQEC